MRSVDARGLQERLARLPATSRPGSAAAARCSIARPGADLDAVVRHADLVGLSFAQSADDVRALRSPLVEQRNNRLLLSRRRQPACES